MTDIFALIFVQDNCQKSTSSLHRRGFPVFQSRVQYDRSFSYEI